MIWTKRKGASANEYLNGVDIQKIRCMKWTSMVAEDVHDIIKYLKKSKNAEKFRNLKTMVVDCRVSKKVPNDFCKLIRAIPSITELIFDGWLGKENGEELYKGLQKIPSLKKITVTELGLKEDIKFIQTSKAELHILCRYGSFSDKSLPQFSDLLKNSSTIRSLEFSFGAATANNYVFPAIVLNTSLTQLHMRFMQPGCDFSLLKPLTLPTTSNNLQVLELGGNNYQNGEQMEVFFDILDNNTKLTKLTLTKFTDFQTQLGRFLTKNTTLKSLTVADLTITQDLLDAFKVNTTLVEISLYATNALSVCQSVIDNPKRNLKALEFGPDLCMRHTPSLPSKDLHMALCQMLKTVQLTKLEVISTEFDVDLLIQGLNSPNNNVRVLRIVSTDSFKNNDTIEFMRGMERNTKIQKLDLRHISINDNYQSIWNMLLKNKTILSLIIQVGSSKDFGVSDESFKRLMQALKINTTLLYLEITPRSLDSVVEIFLNDTNHASISLWQFAPLSDAYEVDLILRNNNRRYMDMVVLYNNIKRCNNTNFPLEMWTQIFSHLI